MTEKTCAIILARGGSKGIPGKNTVDINGWPMFMWSVLAALEDDVCDSVIVSSDSSDILKICSDFNDKRVYPLPRPSCFAGDKSPSELSILHAIKTCAIKEEEKIVFLQPTSIFRYGDLIKKCIQEVRSGVSAFTAFPHTPLFWTKYSGNHALKQFSSRKMRQEYAEEELAWHDCGNVYSFISGDFYITADRHVGNCKIIPVDKIQSLQIDEPIDLELCRKLIENENINTWMKKIAK